MVALILRKTMGLSTPDEGLTRQWVGSFCVNSILTERLLLLKDSLGISWAYGCPS
jgi:hypothetical protein